MIADGNVNKCEIYVWSGFPVIKYQIRITNRSDMFINLSEAKSNFGEEADDVKTSLHPLLQVWE